MLPGRQADVRPSVEAMDVFVRSSRSEGIPNGLLEAMAMEVPCVAARTGGVLRVVEDGRNGRTVPPGDAAAVSAAVSELARDPDRRDEFRKAGRRTVETRFSLPVRMQRIAGLYDELLASSSL